MNMIVYSFKDYVMLYGKREIILRTQNNNTSFKSRVFVPGIRGGGMKESSGGVIQASYI
jgi:hypothetical protein